LLYDNDLSATDQAGQPGQPPWSSRKYAPTSPIPRSGLPDLALDESGKAETEITFPQSLTTWRVRGYALTKSTQVGDATAQATTTKNLLVRLQSPRFFIERDEVVLSANVHNYLPQSKQVRAELIVPSELFSYTGLLAGELAPPDKDGNLHIPAQTTVKANGEQRLDWPSKYSRRAGAHHREGADRRGKRRYAPRLSGSGAWHRQDRGTERFLPCRAKRSAHVERGFAAANQCRTNAP
jgi:hypothetical protein